MSNISQCLDKALKSNLMAQEHDISERDNVLITAAPGQGTIAECMAWAKANMISLVVVNAADPEAKNQLDLAIKRAEDLPNVVVLIDNYDRVRRSVTASLFAAIAEVGISNNFVFCIVKVTPDCTLTTAEASKFTYKVRNIPDDYTGLTESYRRTVSRGKTLVDNDLFVNFD